MRILHTSDWHIGRTFHGHQTQEALAGVLDALVAQVREHAVDTVVIAGDVFDSATPAAPAYLLLDEVLAGLHAAGAHVIVTSGNHDSAARLGFHSRLLRDGIHLLTDPGGIPAPVTIADAHGQVHFFGIPYLEPALVRHLWPEHSVRTQQQAMTRAMELVREGMTANPGRAVAIAHCFAAGVETTEGLEREVRQGGLDLVPLDVFDGPDYVALGHIHGRQRLSPRVRYSGAPLHYSFGERHRERGSWLVDLDASGLAEVQWLPLPIPRRLVTIRGTFVEILSEENVREHADDWLCAVYTDPVPQREPMQRLRQRFPFCAMVQHEPEGGSQGDGRSYAERVTASMSDTERIEEFLMHVRAGEGPSAAESVLIRDALDDQSRAEAMR